MDYRTMNDYLTKIFNNVSIIEESTLKGSQFSDISVKEMHTIDIIGRSGRTTPSYVAKELMLTIGTVTISLNKLVKKGYVEKTRSALDKRVVNLSLTKKGKLLYRLHNRFHRTMVNQITENMGSKEVEALELGLKNLHDFLERFK